jgi:hypothetical protein
MGRIKRLYDQLLEANGGMLPPEITIEDLHNMEELKNFEWEKYEQEQENVRLQFIESEDPTEISKIEQANKKFSAYYGTAREAKKGE